MIKLLGVIFLLLALTSSAVHLQLMYVITLSLNLDWNSLLIIYFGCVQAMQAAIAASSQGASAKQSPGQQQPLISQPLAHNKAHTSTGLSNTTTSMQPMQSSQAQSQTPWEGASFVNFPQVSNLALPVNYSRLLMSRTVSVTKKVPCLEPILTYQSLSYSKSPLR